MRRGNNYYECPCGNHVCDENHFNDDIHCDDCGAVSGDFDGPIPYEKMDAEWMLDHAVGDYEINGPDRLSQSDF